jgi:DNA repair photolyase
MHFIKAKQILSAKNGINIYRGCTHGCIYCDSRSKCYQMNHAFENIAVKENAIELLEAELSKKKKKVMVSTGAMSDPYMPIESKLQMTRKMLEKIYQYKHGVHIQTKSSLILRDLDLLVKINQKAKAVVSITLTTADEDLCKILEPHVATTRERVHVLKTLADNFIPTGVWLCPLLPFINDTEENISTLLDLCIDSKVKYIICFGFGLTLRAGNREYFYEQLDVHFPTLKEKYMKVYADNYQVNSQNHAKLNKYFKKRCQEHNILTDINEIFVYLSSFEEKVKEATLFDL